MTTKQSELILDKSDHSLIPSFFPETYAVPIDQKYDIIFLHGCNLMVYSQEGLPHKVDRSKQLEYLYSLGEKFNMSISTTEIGKKIHIFEIGVRTPIDTKRIKEILSTLDIRYDSVVRMLSRMEHVEKPTLQKNSETITIHSQI